MFRFLFVMGLLGCPPAHDLPAAGKSNGAISYPMALRGDVVDEYHSTKIADPYRWLEAPDSTETRAWVDAQNQLFGGWISQVPEREKIRTRLEQLWNYERFTSPQEYNGKYFYTRNDGLQNQAVLYVAETLEADPKILLDPNTLSADGTVSLADWAVSDNGQYLAYGISDGGSDWMTWRVRDVSTSQDTGDELKWIKFSTAAWTADNQGFFYSRFPEPASPLEQVNLNQKVYYHKLGTPQSSDTLIYEHPDQPEWGFESEVTEDGTILLIYISEGTEEKNRVYLKDLTKPDAPIVPLLDGFDASYHFLGNIGTIFYFTTDHQAPKKRVIAVDITNAGVDHWREIVPQADQPIESSRLVGNHLILHRLSDAKSLVQVVDLHGKVVNEIPLPGIGTADNFTGMPSDTESFFTFTGYTVPTTVYRYDVAAGTLSEFRKPKVDFNPNDYVTEQVFYRSQDGTQVPMFITHKQGVVYDGNNPTLLYGYGGFNISITPLFSAANLVWMENGGVYAVANLRGGGEYGREWHEAGILDRKQNVFNDFIAAAEYLIDTKVTSSKKLAIQGRSNGGLLVGATMTQRPDLFAAALPGVGVLDMLRYHQFTIGWAWASDYGTSDDAAMFSYLLKYSPVHHIQPGTQYPATLITTADHDDRVVPAHSYKFAATLQNAQAGAAPIFIRIDTRAGHGAGKPTSMLIDEQADVQAFLVRSLQMTLP